MLNRQKKGLVLKIVNLIISIFVILIIMVPLLWTLSFSFKPESEQFVTPTTFFSENYTIQNYKEALKPEFIRYLINSAIVSIITLIIALTISIFSAYAFSKLNFFGKRFIYYLILLTQLIPIVSIVIPVYQILRNMGLINTYMGMLIAYLTFTVPVSIWLLKSFFDNIPVEIEEAAMVDGCTKIGAFFRTVIPLSKPGIAAASIWIVVATWQEFIYALAITTTTDMRTVTVGILDFFGQFTINYGVLFAGAILISIPIVILFLFLQKYFIAGLTEGSVKG